VESLYPLIPTLGLPHLQKAKLRRLATHPLRFFYESAFAGQNFQPHIGQEADVRGQRGGPYLAYDQFASDP